MRSSSRSRWVVRLYWPRRRRGLTTATSTRPTDPIQLSEAICQTCRETGETLDVLTAGSQDGGVTTDGKLVERGEIKRGVTLYAIARYLRHCCTLLCGLGTTFWPRRRGVDAHVGMFIFSVGRTGSVAMVQATPMLSPVTPVPVLKWGSPVTLPAPDLYAEPQRWLRPCWAPSAQPPETFSPPEPGIGPAFDFLRTNAVPIASYWAAIPIGARISDHRGRRSAPCRLEEDRRRSANNPADVQQWLPRRRANLLGVCILEADVEAVMATCAVPIKGQ